MEYFWYRADTSDFPLIGKFWFIYEVLIIQSTKKLYVELNQLFNESDWNDAISSGTVISKRLRMLQFVIWNC